MEHKIENLNYTQTNNNYIKGTKLIQIEFKDTQSISIFASMNIKWIEKNLKKIYQNERKIIEIKIKMIKFDL